MTTQTKIWTRLGLSTAVTVGLVATGCSAEPAIDAPLVSVAEAPATGGEAGGEGGVSVAQAATDPVVYSSALAIAEAHVLAGRDAYAAGETDAAAEMFSHPVSEVLAQMEEVFEARGVTDFTDLFLDASDAAYSGESLTAIDTRVAAITVALRNANMRAPESSMEAGSVIVRVIADQIDRAAHMYPVAQESEAYEPYLDGYGFYKVARVMLEDNRSAIAASDAEILPQLDAALAALEGAYPTALRPEMLDQPAGQLTALASQLLLSLN